MTPWTSRSGTGAPLVLCHGGPGIWDYFDDVAGFFDDTATVIRWDQRGCGRSPRDGPYTVARFVADLDDLGDRPRFDVLGHSWGALLALLYALEHPGRVNRIVYVSGVGIDPEHTWKPTYRRNFAARVDPRWYELEDGRERAILQWSTDFVDPATAREHAERMATPWHGLNPECADALNAEVGRYLERGDLPARCRGLTVPTLIVDGRHDLRPRDAVDSLERALPDVRRVSLDAGHVPWVEEPAGFRRTVREFLADSAR
ncbi:alpha/beta hydrolase [Cryptosporangium japonicum]|uniref:Alpha/beta hydrolase n=1 Tax=Cryptosporangium japonicum TaxID=80872 RepID=A0ABN0TM15_9ACTN